MSILAVMTTIDDAEKAQAIASALVERKLAACVQISKMESVYKWQGSVQQDTEYRLLAKTPHERYAEVEAAIIELHSYDLPALFAFEIAEAYGPYADWVEAECGQPD